MVVTSSDKSRAVDYYLVSFVPVGGGTPVYYTDWTVDIQHTDGNEYVSVPTMAVKLPRNDGLFTEEDVRVDLPLSADTDDFTYRYSTTEPWPEVEVTITEIVKDLEGAASTDTKIRFAGLCHVTRRNPEGVKGRVLINCITVKSLMAEASLGFQCTHHCGNRWGDKFCQIDTALHTFTATISSIAVAQLAMSGMPGGHNDRYFQRGTVAYQGLTIRIHDWRSATLNTILLTEQPPASWAGKVVIVKAGCGKTIEECREEWNNESQFKGLGFKMPPYDPRFEGDPQQG